MPIVGGGNSGVVTVEIQGKIDDITAKVDALDNSFDQFTAKTDAVNAASAKAAQQSKMSWTDFRSMYSTVLDVVRTGQQIWDATGQKFADNAIAVGDMARALGVTTEEASRLKEMGDDVGMTLESLTVAMKLAQKNGIEPDVKGIAALSDKYLALNPGVERSQFLLDNFGRSGMEMGKLLDKGSASILAMSAAIDKNLLVTSKAYEEAQKYKIATNELGDSWNALVYKSAPPLVNAVATIMNQMRDAQRAQELYTEAGYKGLVGSTALAPAYLAEAAAEREKTDALKLSTAAQNDGTDTATLAVEREKDLAAAIKATTEANTGMLGIIQSVQNEMNGYNQKLSDAISKYGESSVEVTKLADDHNKAMKRIAYDLLLTKLEANGFTDVEFNIALQAGLSAGLIDQASIDMAKSMNDAANAVQAEADKAAAAINNIPSQKDIFITSHYSDIYSGAGYTGAGGILHGHANGGSFIIPPGFENEKFMMPGGNTASSGERVTVTPQRDAKNNSGDLIDYNRLARVLRDAMMAGRG